MRVKIFHIVFAICIFCFSETGNAQNIKKQNADTVLHSAKKATYLAIFLPGSGQIYNKKYWKVPIIYAGFAALVYSVSFYQTEYDRFRHAVINKRAGLPTGDAELEQYPVSLLLNIRESYRESRDLSFVGIFGLYALQVLDAAVDAHLYEFNVNESVSVNYFPQVIPAYGRTFVGGTISIHF